MRVFKPSYSIPRPPRSRVLDRKGGKWARWTDRKGEQIEGRLSKSGKRVLMEVNCWHIQFTDHLGILRRLKGFNDRTATDRLAVTVQDLLNAKCSAGGIDPDLQRRLEGLSATIRTELAASGLLGEKALAAAKPLSELIAGYEGSLKARERDKRHVGKTIADVHAVCEACRFKLLSDIDAGKVELCLKERREDGIGYCRSNAILTAVKSFCRWAVQSGYISDSPVKLLGKLNAKEDRRLIRRALEVNELRTLLAVTAASEERWGFSGSERALIYAFAADTGLRAGEIRQLTVGCIHWDTATLELQAKREKNRQGNVLPIRPDLLERLRRYIGARGPGDKVFPGLTGRTAEMLKEDLVEAGINYADDSGRVFDFHALRGELGTLLAASGVHPKTAQVLMRHSSIDLTMNYYTHTLRGGEAQAVAALPDLLPPTADEQARKTGTHD